MVLICNTYTPTIAPTHPPAHTQYIISTLNYVLFLCMVQQGGFWDYKINFIQLTVSLFQGSHNLNKYKDLLMFWGLRWWRISPHRQKSPSSGCFFKRDFGESSLLKLRNFKTSIRICLCFEGCGGDSFHQIAKKSRQAGASSSWSSENGPSWCREGSEKIKESLMVFY